MIEEFTGTWCGWCPYGADTLDVLQANYPYLRVLSIHQGDTLATTEGNSFINAIQVPGYPSASIDRVLWSGQSKIPIYRELWRAKTDIRNNLESPLYITASGTFHQPSRLMTANIHIDSYANVSGTYNINVIISEDNINYRQYKYYLPAGTGGEYLDPYYHKHVVRKMITGYLGKIFTTSGFPDGGSRDTTIFFIIPSWWNYNKLSLNVMISQMNGNNFMPHLQAYTAALSSIFTNTPVQLLSFDAEKDAHCIKLTWLTESQTNNFGWDVERADESKQWTKIGFIHGNGTSHERLMYEYVDEKICSGVEYQYRLKQIDTDGRTEYSPIVRVTTYTPSKHSIEQNYPNPFSAGSFGNSATTIQYTLPVDERVNITVYDNLGRRVKTLFDGNQKAGFRNAIWDGTNEFGVSAANGTYHYTMTTPSFSATKRMTLLK